MPGDPSDHDDKPAPSRFIRRLAQAESSLASEPRDHEATVLDVVGRFFGEPMPLALTSNQLPTPVDKARWLADLLLYYARAYERGDAEQRRFAEAFINQMWISGGAVAPHVHFTRYVFQMAPHGRMAGVHLDALARRLIEVFSVHYPDLGAKLDPTLVGEALTSALVDGRKNRKAKNKWQALSDAWASTGEKKTPGTFKTHWNEENTANRRLERGLGDR